MLPGVILAAVAVAASAPTGPEKASAIAQRQLRVAREADRALQALRKAREGPRAEQVCRWSRRLMEAERQMSEESASQIAAIDAHLLRMKAMEKLAKGVYHQGALGYWELLEAKGRVLEAECLSSQAKHAEGPRSDRSASG